MCAIYLATREASTELKARSIHHQFHSAASERDHEHNLNADHDSFWRTFWCTFGNHAYSWDAETRLPMGQLSFTEYCASHRTLHANLARGQSPLSELEKVRRIISGMSLRSDLVKATDPYKSLNPFVHNQNFEDLERQRPHESPDI